MKLVSRVFFTLVVTVVASIAPMISASQAEEVPLQTVDYVDLNQYAGVWFEIASFPNWFSRFCVNTQATYTLRDDGKVDVLNECRRFRADGPRTEAKGIARVDDLASNAKLKVRFAPSEQEGDYWIIELGSNYEYAVVSVPSRESLWILSRTKQLPADLLEPLLDRLKSKHGFNLEKLQYTRADD